MHNLQQTTDTYLSVFPATDGKGKWHAAVKVTSISSCGSSASRVILDTTAAPLIVERDKRPHPLACKRCISYWKAETDGA